MKYEVEAARIWNDDFAEAMRSQPWFEAEDFAEAVNVARKHYRETPHLFRGHIEGEK